MKLNFFEKIYMNSVGAIKSDIGKKFKNEEELYFHEQFEQYLKAQDPIFCYKMIDEGYKASNYQSTILEQLLYDKITTSKVSYNDYKSVESINPTLKIMGLLYAMPIKKVEYDNFKGQDYSSEYTESIKKLFNNEENNKVFVNLFREINEGYTSYLGSAMAWGKFIFHSDRFPTTKKMQTELEKILYLSATIVNEDLLKQQEINEIKAIANKASKKIAKYARVNSDYDWTEEKLGKFPLDTFLETIELMQNNYLSKDNKKDVLLNQLKKYHVRNKSLTEEIKELIVKEEYSLDSLPLEAKEKVENIQKIVQGLNSKDATDFTQERLPIILKRYFSIDEEYRTELKNVEGFNAEELMMQSLDNIERIVKAKQEDNNYDLLSELSVENRKLKAKV